MGPSRPAFLAPKRLEDSPGRALVESQDTDCLNDGLLLRFWRRELSDDKALLPFSEDLEADLSDQELILPCRGCSEEEFLLFRTACFNGILVPLESPETDRGHGFSDDESNEERPPVSRRLFERLDGNISNEEWSRGSRKLVDRLSRRLFDRLDGNMSIEDWPQGSRKLVDRLVWQLEERPQGS